jgi:hypothetical protein
MLSQSQVLSLDAAVERMMHQESAASVAFATQDAAFSQSHNCKLGAQSSPTAVDSHPDVTRAIYDFICGKRD